MKRFRKVVCLYTILLSGVFTSTIHAGNGYRYSNDKGIAEDKVLVVREEVREFKSARAPIHYPTLLCNDSVKGITIDESYIDSGQLLICNETGEDIVVQVKFNGDVTYQHLMKSDVTYEIIPLAMGIGTYRIVCGVVRVVGVITIYNEDTVVIDEDIGNRVFVEPNYMCYFNDSSECTKLSNELTEECSTDYDKVMVIADWVVNNIEYDKAYADRLEMNTYTADDILSMRRGVCSEFATLTAAMLRSINIPTKIVWGYMPDGTYHAWNMCCVDGNWIRVDTTYLQGGSGWDYISNDENYSDYKYF